jgi:hypothetical protein
MRKTILAFSVLSVAGTGLVADAQDLKVSSSGSSSSLIHSVNTANTSQDRIAVQGISTPVAWWGIGGEFRGGYMGVTAYSTVSGAGSRTGGYFEASGGTNNNVGIYSTASGGTNTWAGIFVGNVNITGNLVMGSDSKIKKDVKDLAPALSGLLTLKPKTYRYRVEEFPHLKLPPGEQVGLIAQEVAAAFPDLVREVSVPKDALDKNKGDEKILSIEQNKLFAILVKAVQEQQQQIQDLRQELEKLKKP